MAWNVVGRNPSPCNCGLSNLPSWAEMVFGERANHRNHAYYEQWVRRLMDKKFNPLRMRT